MPAHDGGVARTGAGVRKPSQKRTWINSRGLILLRHPHILTMTQWQPPKREPPKTKAELREMLTEAVRNSQAENKRLQKAKKVKMA
jgi:hypothetical protein